MDSDPRRPLDFGSVPVDEIDRLLDELEPEERELSARRLRAHARIDALRAGMLAGSESLGTLARLQVWERRLSAERRALHACIDALNEARDRAGAPARRPVDRADAVHRPATLLDPGSGRPEEADPALVLDRPLGPRREGLVVEDRSRLPERLERPVSPEGIER